MYEIEGGSELETGWKCGGCSYKFFDGMLLRIGDKSYCPSCKQEIIDFEHFDEDGLRNYIAKTQHSKFSSLKAQSEGTS